MPYWPLVLFVDLVVLAGTIFLIVAIVSARSVPPPISTRKDVLEEIVKAFGPLKKECVFYDLGSGFGNVVRAVAKANPHIRTIGIEKFWFPYFFACLNKPVNTSFIRADISETSLGDATHVYTYLYIETMDTLLPKLEREPRPGTMLISFDFPFTHKPPDRIIPLDIPGTVRHKLFVYTF